MSAPEPEWLLTSWLQWIRARWILTGVPRRDRKELLHQLLRDVAAARAAGARVEELIATHPSVFADSCAANLRSRHRPISVAGLLAVCLGTGMVGAGAAWLLLLSLVDVDAVPPGFDEGSFYLLVDLGLIASVLTAMVAAARLTYRRHAQIAALTPRLAINLVVATVVGFPLASLYGSRWAYSLHPAVVGMEVLIVLVFLAFAVVAARRSCAALRDAL